MQKDWTFKFGDQFSFTEIRTKVIRSFINHLVHHRACLLPSKGRALEKLFDRLCSRHAFGYWYAAGVAITSSASSIW